MTGDDTVVAILIALVILAIVLLYQWRVRPGRLSGRWASRGTGMVFILRKGPRRTVEVSGGGGKYAGATASLTGFRSIALGPLTGKVLADARTIRWANGDEWLRQGA